MCYFYLFLNFKILIGETENYLKSNHFVHLKSKLNMYIFYVYEVDNSYIKVNLVALNGED